MGIDKGEWSHANPDAAANILRGTVDLDGFIKKRAQQAVAVALYPDTDAIKDVLEYLGLDYQIK